MLRFLFLYALLGFIDSKPTREFILEYARRYPNTGTHDPEYADLFEGDILTDEARPMKVSITNIIPGEKYRWPGNTVYYQIADPAFTQQQRAEIKKGIEDIEEKTKVNGTTCIRIVPRTHQHNYVYIEKGNVCSGRVGMRGGPQPMSLGDKCFRHGTIMHEFLHALGFYHEHTRSDRDGYIFVNWDNILKSKEHNFKRHKDIDNLGTPYDYGSVMHYGVYGFAKDDSIPTIIPYNQNVEIGQRTHLSEMDIERIQIAYNCMSLKDSKYFKNLAGKLDGQEDFLS